MRVALVYNQKKEESTQESSADDTSDPPSTDGGAAEPSVARSIPKPSAHPTIDLYAEWDTPETIAAVRDALRERHDVTLIEADQSAYGKLFEERPDIVFNIAEGLTGISREAQVPAMLEMLGIPYTGSDPLTLAMCLDKSRAKEILSYYHIHTPRFSVVSNPEELSQVAARFPSIVKPLHEGSSKGIFNSSVVENRQELDKEVQSILARYDEPALVEEYLQGREFTVAVLGNADQLAVLPIVEIRFDTLPQGVRPIYSYEAKWIWDRSDAPLDIFDCPAKLPDALRREIEAVCRRAYRVMRCRDWCRIDLRLDEEGVPNVLELNPLPGILPNPRDNSCFPKAARAAGLTYRQLIQAVLALAARRYGMVTN